MSQSWTVRFGAEPTPEQLLPREYVSQNGRRVRATLSVATSSEECEGLLDTYTYEGRPANGMQLNAKPGTDVLTTPHTELWGAIRIFCCLGAANIAFEEREPPFPDLHVVIDGKEAFLEMAQVRRDAALHAALRDAQRRVLAAISVEENLQGRLRDLSVVFGCASMPRRTDMDSFATSAIEWLRGLRSRPNDGPVVDGPLAPHVVHVSTFPANADAPVKFSLLANDLTLDDYLDDILDMIRTKNEKRYEGGPLWLGLTVVEDRSAAMLRLRECDVDVGQFERILVTDTQDVVTFEAIS